MLLVGRTAVCFDIVFLRLLANFAYSQGQENADASSDNGMGIVIKDDGLVELVKGDVALIFYITVSNVGSEPVHLSVTSKKCCQKFSAEDEDCESMNPIGGDMGELYPQDTRNLTLIYPNLYLHDRAGYCEMIISSKDGKELPRTVKFNTTLPRGRGVRIPRLLEQYYDPDDITNCANLDQDPLNMCKPVQCLIRYGGYRNFYNFTSQRCEKLPNCTSTTKDYPDMAYVPQSNSCRQLQDSLTPEEEDKLKEGTLSTHALSHSHGYPVNIRCHHGTLDPKTSRCECNKGWDSAPFDPAMFNFDVQVYHMCTVWTGELTAEEVANITLVSRGHGHRTTFVVIGVIGGLFGVVAIVLCVLYFLGRRQSMQSEVRDKEESMRLVGEEGILGEEDEEEDNEGGGEEEEQEYEF